MSRPRAAPGIRWQGKHKRTQKDDSNTDRRTEYVSLVMFFGTACLALCTLVGQVKRAWRL